MDIVDDAAERGRAGPAQAPPQRVALEFALSSHLLHEVAAAARHFLAVVEAAELAQTAALAEAGTVRRQREQFARPRFPAGSPAARGDALRRWRERLGLPQRTVAGVAGYSRGLLADVETGRRGTLRARQAIARALSVLQEGQERRATPGSAASSLLPPPVASPTLTGTTPSVPVRVAVPHLPHLPQLPQEPR